jgi:hypothetical protein
MPIRGFSYLNEAAEMEQLIKITSRIIINHFDFIPFSSYLKMITIYFNPDTAEPAP